MFGKSRDHDDRRSSSLDGVVFPDWSPYNDLAEAAKAYLRDPELALEDLTPVLGDRPVLGFTLERVVLDGGQVWQEVVLCDGDRLVLWHGEDVPDAGMGAMTSAVRITPLASVAEVGTRRHLTRDDDGVSKVSEIEAYVLLRTLDEAEQLEQPEGTATVIRHDAIRFAKTVANGGEGQVRRVQEFVRLVATRVGSGMPGSAP
ncbi:hypothetical protein [Fodinicola feengrottensis]|uniref:Uncharacterized protein n=1 Tax=Fodinicola feengrottensis TaxID=435914 RepID=A0ABN2HX94_9ACTN|nr:hypothetical protein [Fodinicola feengrottensis]